MQDWFINDYILNEVGRSPLVSGFFWDDVWNPTCNIHDQTRARRTAPLPSALPPTPSNPTPRRHRVWAGESAVHIERRVAAQLALELS
eukprot:SAG11_NODE_6973_length_1216_cov_1.634736_2_plen_87_part_01